MHGWTGSFIDVGREADRAELAVVRRKVHKASETPEERDAVAGVYRELNEQQRRLEQRIAAHRRAPLRVEPQRQVEAALGSLDRLTKSLAAGTANWAAIGSVFGQTNTKLYLRFSEVEKGRRKVTVPAGGVVTFGSTPPPGPLYMGPTDRPIIRKMLAIGEPVTATPEFVAPGDSNAGQDVIGSANVQRGTRRCT